MIGFYGGIGCAGSRLDRDPAGPRYCGSGSTEEFVYVAFFTAGLAVAVVLLIAAVPVSVRYMRRRRVERVSGFRRAGGWFG